MSDNAFALVFPGQGSQTQGLLAELAAEHPVIKDTFAEASDALDYDMWALCLNGPESQMGQTEYTQPIMLTAGIACWRLWCGLTEARPIALAGHSLGEYSALIAAEALQFADTVKLVRLRGQLMQQAVPEGEGGMAAIVGLSDEKIAELCASIDGIVAPANFNAPGQVVIAGSASAVDQAIEAAKPMGAKLCKKLAMSAPSHSELMIPAAEQLKGELANLPMSMPTIPVVHNVDAQTRDSVDAIREALFIQVFSPVRWVQCVQGLAGLGAQWSIESGCGQVLTGLQKRIDRKHNCISLATPAGLEKALAQLG